MKSGLSSLIGTQVLLVPAFARAFSKSLFLSSSEDSDVIIKVLGTAQDAGFPHMGCHCQNCQRAREDPGLARLKSSIAILDMKEMKAFIVDASPDISPQLNMIHDRMRHNPTAQRNTPHGILLTHAHIGHYTGLMFFGYEGLNTDQIPVFCTPKMARFLEENGPWSQMVRYKNIDIRKLHPEKKTSLTPRVSIVPFLVPHRYEYTDTIGFIIESKQKKLLYIPDIQSWEAWDRSINEEAAQVDYAILDGTFYSRDEHPGRDLSEIGHPFITVSMERLNPLVKSGRVKIYFSHLNHTNPALIPESPARKEIKDRGFYLAADGMEFPL